MQLAGCFFFGVGGTGCRCANKWLAWVSTSLWFTLSHCLFHNGIDGTNKQLPWHLVILKRQWLVWCSNLIPALHKSTVLHFHYMNQPVESFLQQSFIFGKSKKKVSPLAQSSKTNLQDRNRRRGGKSLSKSVDKVATLWAKWAQTNGNPWSLSLFSHIFPRSSLPPPQQPQICSIVFSRLFALKKLLAVAKLKIFLFQKSVSSFYF